jgi:hypothetical protein
MLKSNLLRVAVLAALMPAIICTSCNKDDDDEGGATTVTAIEGTLTGTIPANVDELRASVYWGDEWNEYEVGKCAFDATGKFKIDLPATLDSKYLRTIDIDEDAPNVKVSNPNVKTASITSLRTFKDGERTYGNLSYIDKSAHAERIYMYADGDVTIKGSGTEKDDDWTYVYDYNVTLKKGWNLIYVSSEENEATKTDTEKLSNNAPAGLKWVYYE